MCGLIAATDYTKTKFPFKFKEELFAMLLINSLRGAHSTGLLGVKLDTKTEYIKGVGDPWTLWHYKEFDTFLNRVPTDYTAVLGHGRYSTRGATVAKNAHPFIRSHINLIHNGTITNFDILKKDYPAHGAGFEVDSDMCANMIATQGVKETMKQLIGGFAFIWYDSKEHKLKAIRNNERPLFMIHRTLDRGWMLSSDPYIFDYLKKKSKFEGEILPLESGVLYTFNFENAEVEKERISLHTYQYSMAPYYNRARESVWESDEYGDMCGYGSTYYDKQDVSPESVYHPPEMPSHTPTSSVIELPINATKESGKAQLYYQDWGSKKVWKLTEYIRFVPNGATEKVAKGGSAITTVIRGTTVSEAGIEVTGVYDGDLMDLAEAKMLVGKIKHITVLDSQTGEYRARFQVEDIQPWQPDPGNDVVYTPPAPSFLTLQDNTKLARHRYETLAVKKCGNCLGDVKIEDSQNVLLIDENLYCKDCVVKGEYPKNG